MNQSHRPRQSTSEQPTKPKLDLVTLVKFRQYLVVALVLMVIVALLIPPRKKSRGAVRPAAQDTASSNGGILRFKVDGDAFRVRENALAADQRLRAKYPSRKDDFEPIRHDGGQDRSEMREQIKQALSNFDNVVAAPAGSIQAQLIDQLDDLQDQ